MIYIMISKKFRIKIIGIKKISIGENTMKKIITFILVAISIVSISVLFTGCGKQTADDLTG